MDANPALTAPPSMGQRVRILGLVKFALPVNWKRTIVSTQAAMVVHQKVTIVATLMMGAIAAFRSLRRPHQPRRLTMAGLACQKIVVSAGGTMAIGTRRLARVSIAPSCWMLLAMRSR